jgi:hypothetical protein
LSTFIKHMSIVSLCYILKYSFSHLVTNIIIRTPSVEQGDTGVGTGD